MNTSPFQLPALPWQENALEPVISARTIGLHHGKLWAENTAPGLRVWIELPLVG